MLKRKYFPCWRKLWTCCVHNWGAVQHPNSNAIQDDLVNLSMAWAITLLAGAQEVSPDKPIYLDSSISRPGLLKSLWTSLMVLVMTLPDHVFDNKLFKWDSPD